MKRSKSGILVALCFATALSVSIVLQAAPAQASTWAKVKGGTIHYFGVDFVDASHGWVGGVTYIPEGMMGIEDSAIIGRTETAGVAWEYSTGHEVGEDLSYGWNFLTATALDFVDGSHGWAVLSDGTIIATASGGERWAVQAEGSSGYADNNWEYVSLSMVDTGHGCAVGGWVGFIGTTYPRIVYTENGSDWIAAEFETPANSSLESVHMIDADYGWAVGSRVPADNMPLVLVTHDGGATWTRQTKGLPSTGIGFHGVWFVDRQHGWAVGDYGMIYVTVDGGATWWSQPSGTSETLLDVGFAPAETGAVTASASGSATAQAVGWVVGERGTILETVQSGLPWVLQSSDETVDLQAVASAGGSVWVVGDEGTILTAVAPAPSSSGAGFDDIVASPYRSAIESLAAAGIVGGFQDGTFRPEASLKRAQFAKIIVGVLGIDPGDSTATRFTDLGSPDAAGYPHKYVQAAFDHGITRGTNTAGTLFAPWEPVRRDQLTSMIVRGVKSLMTGVLEGPPADTPTLFAGIGEPHGDNLRIAEYNGLLAGLLDLGGPDGVGTVWDVTLPATRGEVAQMLYNLRLK